MAAEKTTMSPAAAKQLILSQWRELPSEQRSKTGASIFAVRASEEFRFEAENPYGLIWRWLVEDLK
jgi:hypothetical protein